MYDPHLVVPVLLPGECMPGWLGRFAVANTQDNSHAFLARMRVLFKTSQSYSADVAATSQLVSVLTGTSSEKLLWDHSLYPWKICCTSLTHSDGGDPWQIRYARAGYCPVCIRKDHAKYGWSYWHISHQIPGVCYCVEHQTRLGFSSTNQFISLSPALAEQQGDIATPQSPFVKRISEIAVHMMLARQRHNPALLRTKLHQLLLEKSGTGYWEWELTDYFLLECIESIIPENWRFHVFPKGMSCIRLFKQLRLPKHLPISPLMAATKLALLCDSFEEANQFLATTCEPEITTSDVLEPYAEING